MISSAPGMHPKPACVMLNWVKTSPAVPLPAPGPCSAAPWNAMARMTARRNTPGGVGAVRGVATKAASKTQPVVV